MITDKLKEGTSDSVKYMCDEITHICSDLPKRAPGSEGEKIACEYMAEQLQGLSDDVKMESFKLNPSAFMGWVYITVTCILLAFVCYFFATMVSLVLIVVAIIPMLLQFIFYMRALDPLYKEKTSYNVTAVKKCSGEVKQRIFYNGHVDAANEWSTSFHFNGTFLIVHFLLAMVGIVYLFAIDIARWVNVGMIGAGIAEGTYLYLGLAGIVFIPVWFLWYFFSNPKVVVDGANDNLTGCYMGIAILKALKDNNIDLKNTEVGVIITGSEEAGLRGAKAWSEAHKGEYQDVPTYIFAYDTIHDGEFFQINRKDLNGFVKSNKEACDMFAKAAKDIDVRCLEGIVPFGATDGAAFNKGGFKCASITALNHNLQKYYHTRLDTADNMDEKCLADCYKVSVQL
ncbi:MAG: M20/M25/M40 family metallo-hydrolase, partial [Clostridia bacterium]